MNKYQRKQLSEIIEKLESIKCEIGEYADEEREKYDNMPESLQDTEKAEVFEQNADDLEEVCDDIDSIIEQIQDVVDR